MNENPADVVSSLAHGLVRWFFWVLEKEYEASSVSVRKSQRILKNNVSSLN